MAKSTAKPATKPAAKPATKPAASGGLPSAARVTARAKKDPEFLKRALANAGLRGRITDTTLLNPAQRQARELHTRLTSPIVTGSKITGADLAHQAAAAGQVEFGPKEQDLKAQLLAQQQRSGDIDRWYGQYLAQVQNYAQGVGQAEDVATGQIAGLGAGVTGLGQETAQRIQQGANQDAAARGTTAQNIVPLADQGTVARQALVGSYVGQQAQRAAAEKDYAAGLAGPVAGAQRLGALTGQQRNIEAVRKKQSELTGLKSAANLKYRTTKTQQEFANQIALGTLDVSQSNALQNTPAAKAAAATTTANLGVDAANAKTAGIGLKTYQALPPADQVKAVAAGRKRTSATGAAADKPQTTGAFIGMTPAQIAKLPQAEIDKRTKRYYDLTHKPGGPGNTVLPSTQYERDFFNKYGIKPAGTPALNKARSDIAAAQTWLGKVGTKDTDGKPITTQSIVDALASGQSGSKTSAGIPKIDRAFIRAALDVIRYGGVTNPTAARLHHMGYSVNKLGLKPGKPKPPYRPPSSGPAARIPGLGGN